MKLKPCVDVRSLMEDYMESGICLRSLESKYGMLAAIAKEYLNQKRGE